MTFTGNFFFDFVARKRNIFSRPGIYCNNTYEYILGQSLQN